jgi:arylformamidase
LKGAANWPQTSAEKRAMTGIDYEKEYDNRGRVKEHPEIFARWSREAAAYRKAMRASGAKLNVPYGPSARQVYDYFPGRNAHPDSPIAVFIHGGWWRSLEPATFSQLARGLNAHGINVAMPGYDLCPTVGIAAIIEQMRAFCLALWRAHKKRLMVLGHSAGGHLSACLAATDWHKVSSESPADLVPFAYAISGVFDLAPLLHVSQNADLRLDAQTAKSVSPIYWTLPPQRSLDAVVGREESSEFLRQSRTIVEAWAKQGAVARYEELPGNHFTVIDPLADPDSPMTARVARLAERVNIMLL